jgi:hypothetical protein
VISRANLLSGTLSPSTVRIMILLLLIASRLR